MMKDQARILIQFLPQSTVIPTVGQTETKRVALLEGKLTSTICVKLLKQGKRILQKWAFQMEDTWKAKDILDG